MTNYVSFTSLERSHSINNQKVIEESSLQGRANAIVEVALPEHSSQENLNMEATVSLNPCVDARVEVELAKGIAAHILQNNDNTSQINNEGVFLVKANAARGSKGDREALLCGSNAVVTFSTSAIANSRVSRAITLTKKEDKKEVEDTDRQAQVDEKFMELKWLLGLGAHDGYEKAEINYSVSWHFIQWFDGDTEKRYDLLSDDDIARLLRDRGLDHGEDDVKAARKELLSINRELKSLLEREAGSKFPTCVQDYMGNVSGPRPFIPTTSQAYKVLNEDKQHGKYLSTLDRLGLITTSPAANIFSSPSHKTNEKGAAALTDMGKQRFLQKAIAVRLGEQLGVKILAVSSLVDENRILSDQEKATRNALEKEIHDLEKAILEFGEIEKVTKSLAVLKQRMNQALFPLQEAQRSRGLTTDETTRIGELEQNISGLDNALSSLIRQANDRGSVGPNQTVLDFTLMQLNKEFNFSEPAPIPNDLSRKIDITATGKETLATKDVSGRQKHARFDNMARSAAKDLRKTIKEENQTSRWFNKTDYKLQAADKALSYEVAAVIHMLGREASEDSARIHHLEFLQSHGIRQISKMPIVEDLLLLSVLKMDKGYDIQEAKDLSHFQERSEPVRLALLAALEDYKIELGKSTEMQSFKTHLPGGPVASKGITAEIA